MVLEEATSSELTSERSKTNLEVLDPRPILDTTALGLLRGPPSITNTHPRGSDFGRTPQTRCGWSEIVEHRRRWSATAQGRRSDTSAGEPKTGSQQRQLLEGLVAHDGSTADKT